MVGRVRGVVGARASERGAPAGGSGGDVGTVVAAPQQRHGENVLRSASARLSHAARCTGWSWWMPCSYGVIEGPWKLGGQRRVEMGPGSGVKGTRGRASYATRRP